MSDARVGIGYDIHRLEAGRTLRVGGVDIPSEKGLVGHSDADVVLHAVTDALLGAAGLPDIGDLFPDTDPAYQDAESKKLLAEVVARIKDKGYRAINVDLVVHAEAPKLSPYKEKMAASIAEVIGLDACDVSVKAKTNEGVGPLGYADAMACTAVALIARKE